MTHRPLFLALALLLGWVAPATADVVVLNDGRQIEGEVIDTSEESVTVKLAAGTITIPRDRVDSIQQTEHPEDAYRRRLDALEADDAVEAAALADLAGELGRVSEQGRLLELAAKWAPHDPGIQRALARWEQDAPLSIDEDELARLRADTGRDARMHRTAHWAIAYDTGARRAREAGQIFELIWQEFHDFAAQIGCELKPVDHAMEAQIFNEFSNWTAASGSGAGSLLDVVGLYTIESRRTLLYNTSTRPEMVAFLDELSNLERELKLADEARTQIARDLVDFDSDVISRRNSTVSARELATLESLVSQIQTEEVLRDTSVERAVSMTMLRMDILRLVLLSDTGWALQDRVQSVLSAASQPLPTRGPLLDALERVETRLLLRRARGGNLDGGEKKQVALLIDALQRLVDDYRHETSERFEEIADMRTRLELQFPQSNLAAASHEACHQVAIATGFHRAQEELWLCEGLASLFECTSRTNFVIERLQTQRWRLVQSVWKKAGPHRLRRVVSGRAFRDTPALAYSEGYVLVFYLWQEQPESLLRYLDRNPETDDDAIAAFETHFGPIAEVQAAILARYRNH